jgi:hypothetical protein
MKLKGAVVQVKALPVGYKERLLEIMMKYFDNVERENFEQDLAEKDQIILLENSKSGRIEGFSTLKLIQVNFRGENIRVIFSGDTIVERDYWGELALSRVMLNYTMLLQKANHKEKLYWFLICKGYRTYRFLPTYFKEFFPRFDAGWLDFEKKLLDHLARQRFNSQYDPDTGLIRFHQSRERLKPQYAVVESGRLHNAHIHFFLDRNPNFQQGDELACLALIDENNLTPVAARVRRGR